MIGGRYELDRELARGGMGAVWLGTDVVLGRAVAIKRVGAMPGGSSPDLLRAEREARIAASLSHPHIVGVFDLVHDQDQQWLVMEYVEGSTLAEMVRARGPLPGPEVAAILTQAASALKAAHAAGIVHRDVKPSNILVRPDGQAKLSDFGIARAEADASLTQTGLVTGSPAYLAPEVASGQLAGPPADVWSLGATLFHALSGHPPYDVGDNVLGALYRIVHEDPPRLQGAGGLGTLLESTMVVDPNARWSMAEVERYLRDGSGRATGPIGTVAAPDAAPVGSTELLPVGSPVGGIDGPADGTASEATPGTADPGHAGPPGGPGPVPQEWSGRAAGPAHTGQRGGRRGAVLPVAIVVVLLALVAAVALLLLGGTESDQVATDPPPTGTAPSSPSSGSSSSAPPPSDTPSPSATPTPTPDAADMEQFVEDYVSTAAANPEDGFALLTPAYQRASGGIEGYRDGFWGNVRTAQIIGVPVADPARDTVAYTYSYVLRDGTTQQEDVVLTLQFDAATRSYLISGDGST